LRSTTEVLGEVPPRGYLARQVRSVTGAWMADAVRRPSRSLATTDIPTHPSQLTAAWLEQALCGGTPGARVADFDAQFVSAGTATRWRIDVGYNSAGAAAGLPEAVFVKTTHGLRQRLILGGAGVLRGEPTFYSTFRPGLDIEAPLGYFGTSDDRNWKSIALMEDIRATRGATFLSPLDRMSRADMEGLLTNHARMHGHYWNSPLLTEHRLRESIDIMTWSDALVGLRRRSAVGEKRSLDVMPPELVGRSGDVFEAVLESLSLDRRLPQTLLHGDGHVGQVYRTASGNVGLADWQVVHRGRWAHDVAYTINTALEPEDRRAWAKDLIALYVEQLALAGGERLDFEQAWLEYRRHAFYPLIAWIFTIGRAWYQPHYQPDEFSKAIIGRTARAITELGAFDALDASR